MYLHPTTVIFADFACSRGRETPWSEGPRRSAALGLPAEAPARRAPAPTGAEMLTFFPSWPGIAAANPEPDPHSAA
ncbi:MAG: hypothetical protein B9S34_02290 [Opitutia bacterium Tous-C1TDCM]|nr:MAG: hypothetical protein B9S34_02290 [Opitutae bacterium Tous-C1TDCM]